MNGTVEYKTIARRIETDVLYSTAPFLFSFIC